MTAVAQPALARDLHHSSHHVSHHRHHAAQGRHHHAARFHRGAAGLARMRNAAPIESGYSMPQSFARTDATDTPFGQRAVPLAMPVSPLTPHVLGPARATPRNGALGQIGYAPFGDKVCGEHQRSLTKSPQCPCGE